MLLTIFIAVIILVFAALIYDYYHRVGENKQIISKHGVDELEINQSRQIQRQLKEEINTLQNKLRNTLTDPVTNLLSWQLFEDRINHTIKESERYQFTMGLMFVDIDNFKVINDALSYEMGDIVLREVAQRLAECIRQVDSVSRFAKDTFVILLAQLSKPETAAIVAQRILQALSQSFQINNQDLYLTACIGIALYPNDGLDTQSLLRNADHALHLAKKTGTNVCRFYEEKMHLQSQRELAIYNELRSQSIFQEFSLYYQPAIYMDDQSVFCMDAIIHWDHPVLGLISSQELYDYADKQRKLNALSGWLLQNACKQFLAWKQAGFKAELLGIPLSIKQLENSNFVYQLSHILQSIEFNPEWLLIEIKESFLQVSLDVLEKAFNMLTYLKVKIAIDDFGSASFSLRYLKNISIHYLKLDRSFIDGIVDDDRSKALIKSILYLAETMSMQVIVQGVENEQQVNLLKNLGCTIMQGPYLSDPISANDVLTKMTATIT